MSDLDALLDRGRQPGSFVERRRFTLSREKAIAKIREFSLRHPEQYILELVQSAVFAGAQHIAIDTRPEHMLIAFIGGRHLAEAELEGLFDYLFADRADPKTRHLVQLAIGVNAILQRKPRRLRIESGDGTIDGAVRLDLDARGRGTIGRPQQPLLGTYLLVEHPGAWLKRFAGTRLTSEQALIEERCLYTPVPILVNTEAPFGYRPSREIVGAVGRPWTRFDHGDRRGSLHLPSPHDVRPGVRLVIGGVWVNTRVVEDLGTGKKLHEKGKARPLAGVVCDDRLRKTADQSDVVQDRRWAEMLHAVQPEATRLLRRVVGDGYVAPPLAPLPAASQAEDTDQVPGGPLPEPLGSHCRVLGHLSGLPADALRGLPADSQVFWVQPDAELAVGAAADPGAFPRPVLILRPGQALTLKQEAPQLQLNRLTTAADVEFVRSAMARRTRSVTASSHALGGELLLTLTLVGTRPDPGLAGDDATPVAVRHDSRTTALVAAPVNLPGVSAVLERSGEATEVDAGELADALSRQAHSLLQEALDHENAGAARPLLLALLGQHTRQFLVREGASLRCEPALPPSWGPTARQALEAPVLDTTDGPRSLRQLASSQGELTPGPGVDREQLEPLTLRFCPGQVAWRDLTDTFVLAVGQVGDRWVILSPTPAPRPRALIGVAAGPTPEDSSFQPCPGVCGGRWAGEPGTVDWGTGLEALYDALLARELEDTWHQRRPAAVSVARARVLGRLALAHLAVHLGRGVTAPLLRSSRDGTHRSLARWRSTPGFRVAADQGARVVESDTALLEPGALAALEGAQGPLPLRFDDPPEVFTALADPDPAGWLLREEVALDGVSGVLGLRHPHDPSGAVLLERGDGLVPIRALEDEVPCHGLLQLDDPSGRLGAAQLAMLRLSAQRLYQRLAARTSWADPDQARSAWRYGADYVLRSFARRGGSGLSGVAARLARQLELPGGGEATWGPLARWLQLPAERRPDLPAGLALPPLAEPEEEPRHLEGLPLLAAQEELAEALQALGSTLEVLVLHEPRRGADLLRLDTSTSHGRLAVLALNTRHKRFEQALSHPAGRRILLLEMAREVAGLAARQGEPLPLATLQRALMAGTLG